MIIHIDQDQDQMESSSQATAKVSLMRLESGALRAHNTENGIILLDQNQGAGEEGQDFGFKSARNGLTNGCFVSCLPDSVKHHNQQANLILFSDILWVEQYGEDETELKIDYAETVNKKIKLKNAIIQVEDFTPMNRRKFSMSDYILDKSYPGTKYYKKKVMILINPHGGQGKAVEYFNEYCRQILDKARVEYDYMETEYYGHATDIAQNLDLANYDAIFCASGDGIPHEVINGLYLRPDRAKAFTKLIIAQIPCGSGNAMSLSCLGTIDPSEATLALLKKSTQIRADAMSILQEGHKPKLSFLSQTYGVIADSDIGTEWLRWMGPARFDFGVAMKVLQKASYPCEIYIKYLAKDQRDVAMHYESHSALSQQQEQGTEEQALSEDSFKLQYPDLTEPVPPDWEKYELAKSKSLSIFYVGKMPLMAKDVQFFPAALPNDASMDLVISDSRTKILKTAEVLLGVDKGKHVLNEEVHHSKIKAYRLIPKMKKSYISIDGEKFPFQPLQVEIMPGILNLALVNGNYIDTGFWSK